jgi:hypothetical protein
LEFKLLVAAGNRLFGRKFAAAPYQRRLLFLPFCLRPLHCPAEVHPETGLCCLGSCPDCELGRLRQEALDLGYEQVYVVPSSRIMSGRGLLPSHQFIKAKLAQHAPLAALGVVCEWHLRQRLLPETRVGRSGYQVRQGVKAALHGVLLDVFGVGVLLQSATDEEKDVMVASIGPFWDANETWLVLGIGILLVAFPLAHGVILTALYLPVALMLVGHSSCGVSPSISASRRRPSSSRAGTACSGRDPC